MPIINLILRAICSLRANKQLYYLNLFFRGRKNYWCYLPQKETDFCIEGFPSSANSYAYNLLKNTFLKSNIAHHTHNILALKLSAKFKTKTILIIRNPKSAITSISSRQYRSKNLKIFSVHYYLIQYIYFHQFVLKNIDAYLICDFDLVINTPETFIDIVSQYLNKKYKIENFQALDNRIKSDMTDWYKKFDKMDGGIPLPGNFRNIDRDLLNSVVEKNHEYYLAEELYKEIRKKVVAQ